MMQPMNDTTRPAERRAALVSWLKESGADVIDIMDAQSGIPTVPDWRAFIYHGTPM